MHKHSISIVNKTSCKINNYNLISGLLCFFAIIFPSISVASCNSTSYKNTLNAISKHHENCETDNKLDSCKKLCDLLNKEKELADVSYSLRRLERQISQRSYSWSGSNYEVNRLLDEHDECKNIKKLHKSKENSLNKSKQVCLTASTTSVPLATCKKHLKENRLTSGKKGDAYSCYKLVLTQDKNNLEAVNGINKIEEKYAQWIKVNTQKGNSSKVKLYLEKIYLINPKSKYLPSNYIYKKTNNLITKNSLGMSFKKNKASYFERPVKQNCVGLSSYEKEANKKLAFMNKELIKPECKQAYNKKIIIDKNLQMATLEISIGNFKQFISSSSRDVLLTTDFIKFNAGSNLSSVRGVSTDDARDFIKWLNIKEMNQYIYRLPTLNEWEHFARAGSKSKYHWGNNKNKAKLYAWYGSKFSGTAYKGGTKKPNNWGLYDMSGNVDEIVIDDLSNECLSKGGSMFSDLNNLEISHTNKISCDAKMRFQGFRLVRVPKN